ncbi:MAG: ATP-dependent zinc protease [Pseudomonadota bacterium]|nr:ATP-dependent zinc protease [Pseudomonadota bacterium]
MRWHATESGLSLASIVVLSAALSVTLLAGCSHWPGPDHRAVTLEAIEAQVAQACQPQQTLPLQLDRIEAALAAQALVLDGQTQSLSDISSKQVARSVVPARPCPAIPATPVPVLDNKILVGSTEWVFMTPPGQYLTARVDTGAETSSISATNIVRFERDGKRWVAFDLDTGDAKTDVRLEAPLKRSVRIRQASFDDIDRRAVVAFDVRLGKEVYQDVEFTLADRTRMSYPVLLGRSFLKDIAVVDVGREFAQPRAEKVAP